MVKTFGSIDEITLSFTEYIQTEVECFIEKYNDIFNFPDNLVNHFKAYENPNVDSLRELFIRLKTKNIRIFLIIDEYDNFANNVLTEHGEETYTKVTHAGGFLRSFFTVIKGLTDNREIDRLFITGVSPLVMADVTSGFNIGDNISQDPQLSAMIGISNDEAKQILDYYDSFGIFNQPLDSILADFNQWYNGYSFNWKLERIYNTISVLYYIHQYIKNENRPIILTDENMRTDYGKFRLLLTNDDKLNGSFSVLRQVVETGEASGEFVRSFALKELIDKEKFLTLLFYLGFTSIKEITPFGKYTYTMPNKMINTLLWEFIQKSINEVYHLNIDRYFLGNAFSAMANQNNWRPVLQYIVDKFYEAVSIRDFVFHEEGIKTFLLAWLNMTNLFRVTSEKELNQGFADIYLEPESRYLDYVKFGYVIELKYIKSEFLKSKKKAEPEIIQAIESATAQLDQYPPYDNCTTTKIIIVASAKKLLYMDIKY
jgi:hypothetical protein